MKYSERGLRHIASDIENQDALCYAQDNRFCVISLADGVSECKEAKKGAETAGRAITELLLKKGGQFLGYDGRLTAELALSHILFCLNERAADDNEDIAEYSSTFSSVLLDKRKKRMLVISLGDNIVMAVKNGICGVLAQPSDSRAGCCVTTTKGAEKSVYVRQLDAGGIDSVVICSDGAWREMFDKNRLCAEVAALIGRNKYEGLKSFLSRKECYDDHSFISLELKTQQAGGCYEGTQLS